MKHKINPYNCGWREAKDYEGIYINEINTMLNSLEIDCKACINHPFIEFTSDHIQDILNAIAATGEYAGMRNAGY